MIPERVFEQIKEPRGFRRFSLRGQRKVRCEWALVTLCHNVLKILSSQQAIESSKSSFESSVNPLLNHLFAFPAAFLK